MRVLLVYDSPHGATRSVAEAVASGLGDCASVTTVDARSAPPLERLTVDLLVVGAPSHVMGALPAPRRTVSGREASARAGMRAWLDSAAPVELAVAAFGTHVSHRSRPWLAGAAIQRRLRRLGCRVVAPAATFCERLPSGPLGAVSPPGGRVTAAELARAYDWGARVGALAARAVPAVTGA